MLGEPAPDLGSVLVEVLRAMALLVALLAPGYVWARVVSGPRALRGVDLFVLALGLGLMAYVLGGLLLDATPWGLQRATWVAWLVFVVAGGAIVAQRRGALPKPKARRPGGSMVPRRTALLHVAAAGGLTCAAFAVAYVGARTQPYEGFTQAWVLPAAGSPGTTAIGLTSVETATVGYRVDAAWNGTLHQRFDGIVLAPGETWTSVLDLIGGPTTGELEILVFRASETTAYRRLTFVLGDAPGMDP